MSPRLSAHLLAALLLLPAALPKPSYPDKCSDSSNSENALADYQLSEKRASNLGGRLMCQLDSRNCGGFNVGKKFLWSWRNGEERSRRGKVESARARLLPLMQALNHYQQMLENNEQDMRWQEKF